MHKLDTVVVGAGVIGLATARACALAGHETLLLEAGPRMGEGTSSRNSEVIHAGIHYPQNMLKSRLCIAGRDALYAYCVKRRIPFRRCGKLLVATDDSQLAGLENIARMAASKGLTDMRWLGSQQARAIEPELHCVAALESPYTGIIDSHSLMLSLLGDLEAAGGLQALRTPLLQAHAQENGFVLHTGGEEPMELFTRRLINCAGLQAQELAGRIRGLPPQTIPASHMAKGNYFSLAGKTPFSRLIYPLPQPGGLGVHLTLDLAGRARFGPDVQWLDSLDYTVDAGRASQFQQAIRSWWPGLPDNCLIPDYAGIRPKLSGPGEPPADFMIQDASVHGLPGLVNLYGIESPGLTACLAIADEVLARL